MVSQSLRYAFGLSRSPSKPRKVDQPSALSRRLVAQLQADGQDLGSHGPDDFHIHRTGAGHWQRSAGAWSWSLDLNEADYDPKTRPADFGSQWPVSVLLRPEAKPWQYTPTSGAYEMTIDPCPAFQRSYVSSS
jgi:hypothetical protein